MKLISTALLFCIIYTTHAQNVLISNPDFLTANPLPCGAYSNANLVNFFDAQGAGNYLPNAKDTITICPNLALNSKVQINFQQVLGFNWNVDASDTIYVFDGPNTSSPLIAAINTTTNPGGYTFTSSFTNLTGCLTVIFHSDATNEAAGWGANLVCISPFQPFESHMEAFVNGSLVNNLSPLDTGYVNVCLGDTIMYVAKPIFPLSSQFTGNGYLQNNANSTFEWNANGSGIISTNDTVLFVPTQATGYTIRLKTTDVFPSAQYLISKIRVGQIPLFPEVSALDDSLCFGVGTQLVGGVTSLDTVGFVIPISSFPIDNGMGEFVNITPQIDEVYYSSLEINAYTPGAIINDINDIPLICLNLEYSFLGDIEIGLVCPNGTLVSLADPYFPTPTNLYPGLINGGFDNTSPTYLGAPENILAGVPGTGFNYCFSPTQNTFQTMGFEDNNGNWVTAGNPAQASMNPNGVYLPDGNFNDFIGCPINGTWKVYLGKYQPVDNGNIFEWTIDFDPSNATTIETYQNVYVSEFWTASPFLTGGADTIVSVSNLALGVNSFTYNVVNDFGCTNDTTINVTVFPQPTIFASDTICTPTYQIAGTTAAFGGVWTASSPNVSFSNSNILNPLATLTSGGSYTFTFTDNFCSTALSSVVTYIPGIIVMPNTSICSDTLNIMNTISLLPGIWSSTSPNVSFSNTSALNPLVTFSEPGIYTLTFTSPACNIPETILVESKALPTVFVIDTICNLNYFVIGTTAYAGGVWSAIDTNVNFISTVVNNPQINFDQPGTYVLSFKDNECDVTVSSTIHIPDSSVVSLPDILLCAGETKILIPTITGDAIENFNWSTGETTNSINVTEPDTYILTASNFCYTYIDSAIVTSESCNFVVPNIITPNGDNINDTFVITGDGISEFSCIIVNRWGELIYKYNSILGSWDGKANGNDVVDGVYFYTIKAKTNAGVVIDRQGFVQVAGN